MGSCCTDPTHIKNRNSEDFEDELTDCLEQHKRVLGGWAVAVGLRFCLLDPTAVVHPTEQLLRNRLTSDGVSIWCHRDPVHLSHEAHRDLAHALIEVHDDDKDDTGSVSSKVSDDESARSSGSVAPSSSSGKRKLPDAVVTDQRSRTSLPGWIIRAPVAAGWLRGVSSTTNDSGVRKRGRNDNSHAARGGGWTGGRGRGGRSSWPWSWSGRARGGRRYHLIIHVFFVFFF